jgi:hypothetical protein
MGCLGLRLSLLRGVLSALLVADFLPLVPSRLERHYHGLHLRLHLLLPRGLGSGLSRLALKAQQKLLYEGRTFLEALQLALVLARPFLLPFLALVALSLLLRDS